MSFVVLYDANVLFPNTLRDLLIRIAQAGLVQAKWTERILDETFRNVQKEYPDIDPTRLARTRALICEAVRDCMVAGYEPLVDALELPDKDDCHVLAAAIKARAQVVVTNNIKHFPQEPLNSWDVEAKTADDFVLDQIDLAKPVVYNAVQQIADSRVNPPQTVTDVLVALENDGLLQSAAALRT